MREQSPQADTPLALVIGATGSIGGAVAAALLAHGWRVRAMNRNPAAARRDAAGLEACDWVRGDAMVEADLVAAAQGAQIIVHAGNPAGYSGWAKLLPPMMENVIAAAKASGARILLPGNVYNYGPDAWPMFTETSPQNPKTRKGAIRVALEQRLIRAARDEGVRTLVVRAGDFFGPISASSWLTEGWVRKDKPLTAVALPGPAGIAHDWAYLPDLAESMAQLADREAELEAFALYNHRGHVVTGEEMFQALQRVAGRKLKRQSVPWFAMAVASPFVEMLREMMEMRYLWDHEVVMDNSKLVAELGAEPHTPLDIALRRTLEGQGCLKPSVRMAA
ncbi:NAD-dependent epimerase/dehydratase family protein [Phenylobacterium aquaticum]|uniref:NAD-dependent epimerase/dehydratase family protein n=1 Tax=Phenylobacterium aquaticum TaxID=1763816 RepID=UPI0026F0E5CE|nr:NAD-dependent epimerase/dehydratase family protein [Phenylobacterium aquaticum]